MIMLMGMRYRLINPEPIVENQLYLLGQIAMEDGNGRTIYDDCSITYETIASAPEGYDVLDSLIRVRKISKLA